MSPNMSPKTSPKRKKLKKKHPTTSGKPKLLVKNLDFNNIEEMDESTNFEELIQKEYLRLHRQYRLMEEERHAVASKGNELSKQAKLLDLLYSDIMNMKTDIYNATCTARTLEDELIERTILEILEGFEQINREVDFTLKNLKEVSLHVDKIIHLLVQHKLKVQAIYGVTKTPAQLEKKKRTLENRLYFYYTKFNEKLAENKQIRAEEIDLNLKLRELFHNKFMTMKKLLNGIRSKMSDVVFLATQAYDQRDEIVESIRMIRERNEKENRQHVLEVKDYKRFIDHDQQVRNFLEAKGKRRAFGESASQRTIRKKKSKIHEMDKMLGKYAHLHNSILKKSNFRNMEGLVQSFYEMDQQNFAKVHQRCDLDLEVRFLQQETLEMSTEIEKLFLEAEKRTEAYELEQELAQIQLNKLKKELESYSVMLAKSEINMEEVLQLLESIFTTVGCNHSSFRFLGNENGMRPRIAVFCATLIDNEVRQLLATMNALKLRKQQELRQSFKETRGGSMGLRKNGQHGGPFEPNVLVSNLNDNEEEEDTGRTVHTYEELRDNFLRIKQQEEARRRGTTLSRQSVDINDALDFSTSLTSINQRPSVALSIEQQEQRVVANASSHQR